jgi:EAL and modified HD-GYP domain-containing signal transduction protein
MASELVAGSNGQPSSRAEREAAFTVGLMSTLDAFTDLPLAEIAARLSLSDLLYDGLVHHTGPCGQALHATLAYEAGDAEQDQDDAAVAAYLTAVHRADERWAAIAGF